MSDEKRMDTTLLTENDENTAAEENAMVMKLDKPFTFEGQTYTCLLYTSRRCQGADRGAHGGGYRPDPCGGHCAACCG